MMIIIVNLINYCRNALLSSKTCEHDQLTYKEISLIPGSIIDEIEVI